MKKTLSRKKMQDKGKKRKDTLRSEYRFDYNKSKPNRFAGEMRHGTIAVVLEPDVAAVFDSSKAVNELLRSVISAMSEAKHRPAG